MLNTLSTDLPLLSQFNIFNSLNTVSTDLQFLFSEFYIFSLNFMDGFAILSGMLVLIIIISQNSIPSVLFLITLSGLTYGYLIISGLNFISLYLTIPQYSTTGVAILISILFVSIAFNLKTNKRLSPISRWIVFMGVFFCILTVVFTSVGVIGAMPGIDDKIKIGIDVPVEVYVAFLGILTAISLAKTIRELRTFYCNTVFAEDTVTGKLYYFHYDRYDFSGNRLALALSGAPIRRMTIDKDGCLIHGFVNNTRYNEVDREMIQYINRLLQNPEVTRENLIHLPLYGPRCTYYYYAFNLFTLSFVCGESELLCPRFTWINTDGWGLNGDPFDGQGETSVHLAMQRQYVDKRYTIIG